MNYQVKLNELADDELLNSYVWYEIRSEGLGERFLLSVKNKLLKISEHPLRYPIKQDDFREAGIKGFPFTIIYFVDDIKQIIVVSSIYHNKRNPAKKFKK